MTSKVIYTGELRTLCTHIQSGSQIETDAPTDNHGKGERFSPTDLVATALATCLLTTMAIKESTINITGAECEVEKIMVADPNRRIGEIKITVRFPKNVSYTDKEKAILERIAATCPVAESLHPNTKQTLTLIWPGE